MKNSWIIASLLLSSWVMAQPVKTFPQIWDELYQKSIDLKAIKLEKDSQELSLARAERHWLPRAYVSGQWFNTNDPGQVFFMNLGQRSIKQADFTPSDLNNPNRSTFKTATLGVNLPLYEGGMKAAQVSMMSEVVKASEMSMKAKQSEQYSELVNHYGEVLISERYTLRLNDLEKELGSVIANYQVGSSANPVGYSGILGLKGVKNRIQGLRQQFDLKVTNAKGWINQKIESSESWRVDSSLEIKEFLSNHLTQETSQSYSTALLAQELKVNSMANIKDMEKARYLPQVGLFAQQNVYSGSRDFANSQAYGLYLMWDIFNSDSYGRAGEAEANYLAQKTKIEAGKQTERTMMNQLKESQSTLEKNLLLLQDSEKILGEQTKNAMKLFRSGMLSGLQLAEVINRRVDLIENLTEAENQYLTVKANIYRLAH